MKNWKALLVVCFALLFATAVHAQSTGGVNDSELNGNYAFTFTGFTGNSSVAPSLAFIGRFTADGAGNVTNGELDSNSAASGDVVTAQPFIGAYSIGSDHRGMMTLNVGGTLLHLAFAMMANGNAQFIEFDATGGSGIVGSGTMEKSDATAYSTAKITGDYAFGAAGFDNANNRAAIEGRFTSNGTGTITNEIGDVNAYGTAYAMNFTAANYTVSNTATGRGTIQFAFTFGGAPANLNFVSYVVNAGKIFVMERDVVTTATPLVVGAVLRQQIPAGGFTNASLNGGIVIYLTGSSMCGSGSGVPKAVAGLLTTNGNGALSITYDENYCRAPNSVTGAPGTYSVASNGRATITIGGYSLVACLVNLNEIFLFVSDANVLFGFGEPQAPGPLTNTAVTGTYAGMASDPEDFAATVFSGEFTADGASPTGKLAGTVDIGDASGPVSGQAFSATYSISSSPANGRGTVTITSGSGGSAIAYVISPSKFVMVPMNDPNPSVWIFEQSSTTQAAALSSLTLNPTSVVGGTQNSTGRVKLSAPAPAGGAVVALSSSNTAAAKVPASVTVAAGASSASFTVSASAVSASTAVTIAAAYGGVGRTATLTVTPPPPPAATLSSLTLSPMSVVGGAQNSTGTVTLTGPAPASGAVVTLSSSNTAAARVPGSVTVTAGTTSASFTVSTSAVSASTAVTITAAYGGVSRAATLTVAPAPPPAPTLSSLTLNPTSVVGGTQNSTGTVTLTGPAPASGAVVTLSSSNTAAARVPGSVTVTAGTTSASFTVSTSAVSASTAVTITAAYGGVSRAATLTVAPAPPPAPTLSSLTLSPTSVVGGLQSSTGTVTLSAPAPAGGAVVVLSSSNSGAARVPTSVTVPAGATSVSFTVNTSLVLLSTSSNISASYNGTTRVATLSILL